MPELVAATGLVVVLLVLSMVLLRPLSFAQDQQDAERRVELAALAKALRGYKRVHGVFPSDIPPEAMPLGSQREDYDLCSALVPSFIKDIPLDPVRGVKYKGDQRQDQQHGALCTAMAVDYNSAYEIKQTAGGQVVLSAQSSRNRPIIATVQ